MNQLIRTALLSAAPVFGATVAIALLEAAHMPFPPALSEAALPQWAVFAAVVYSCTVLSTFIVSRLSAGASAHKPGASGEA